LGSIIEVNPVPLNISVPINAIELERVTSVNEEHPLNTPFPMLVTELGSIIEVNPVPLNALFPMLVTEVGMVTSVNAVPLNALSPMLVTEVGMVIESNVPGKGT